MAYFPPQLVQSFIMYRGKNRSDKVIVLYLGTEFYHSLVAVVGFNMAEKYRPGQVLMYYYALFKSPENFIFQAEGGFLLN